MPHHESGLLALKSNDPSIIDRAIKHYTDLAPHPNVELVRGDGGRGVWACFGSLVDVDVSAFADEKVARSLAKALRRPVWVGFAIGGYENHQTAMAFSADGKRLWRDDFDFSFPPKMLAEANDPFASPAHHEALVKRLRAERGYGRIGAEFGLDYFRILDVNAGDPLFATDRRALGKTGAREHAKWLAGPFKQPEGDPGDGAAAPDEDDAVAYKFLSRPDFAAVAALVHELLEHRGVALDSVTAREDGTAREPVLVLEGPGLRAISSTLVWERFIPLVRTLAGASVFAWSWSGRGAPANRGGSAAGNDLRAFIVGQRLPPAISGKGKPRPLTATKAQAKKIAALRKAHSKAD